MRCFQTGATRDSDDGKLDFEGFISPRVLYRFAEYMHRHRYQADGAVRASDNWQKGIPSEAYIKSLARHFMDLWWRWRDQPNDDEGINEALCAILFNAQGLLHERLASVVSYPTDVEDIPSPSSLRAHLGGGCGLAYDNLGPEGLELTEANRHSLWLKAHHPVDRRGRVSVNERW
jgi:hypothetical protein